MLLVGLGNPKDTYVGTRHNVGRDFISSLIKASRAPLDERRDADLIQLNAFFDSPNPLLAVRLKSFMNESGVPLKQILLAENKTNEDVLVIVDDFMIPFGTLRMRTQGSSGGHNGLQSIIDVLGTENFCRLRVGVGPVPESEDPAEFVLEKFSKAEYAKQKQLYEILQDCVRVVVKDGFQKAMTFTNKQHF